ncbi:MAG: VWA domain-containing protein [Paludibacteraceae bacterium]|nr:VWA domain-containing protein [Paludibacteraceae bacterium]
MKKSLLFALALVCSVMTFAQGADADWRIHPDEAQFKIYGTFQTTFPNGGIAYELTNVEPVGLSFPVQPKYLGGETNLGNVYFTFDRVTYPQNKKPDLEHIALWVFDESLQRWVPDEETGNEQVNATNTNEMTVVLVLDCSSSLSEQGFQDVKTSAKSFIDVMLRASNAGNIHIGIIGFSTMKQTRTLGIQPLTAYSASQMKSFVDNFTQGNGTALYRSFDDAFDMTKEYAKTLSKFSSASIVTFTDGLDNGSINPTKKIGSKENYFKYIKSDVLPKSIKGIPFSSYTIFVPGGADVKDAAIENKIKGELKIMAKQDDHFFLVANTSQLDRQFRAIADELVESWKVVSCFISQGQNGKVCWTFGKKSAPAPKQVAPPAPEPVSSGRPLLIGGDLGLGLPMEFGGPNQVAGAGLDFQAGFDFAYPLTDKFALGFYFSLGGGFTGGEYYSGNYFGGAFKLSTGLLMEMGDLNDRPFLLGICPGIGYGCSYYASYIPFELRFGRVLSNNMYITGDITVGAPLGSPIAIEPAIRIGYNFGHNVKR